MIITFLFSNSQDTGPKNYEDNIKNTKLTINVKKWLIQHMSVKEKKTFHCLDYAIILHVLTIINIFKKTNVTACGLRI